MDPFKIKCKEPIFVLCLADTTGHWDPYRDVGIHYNFKTKIPQSHMGTFSLTHCKCGFVVHLHCASAPRSPNDLHPVDYVALMQSMFEFDTFLEHRYQRKARVFLSKRSILFYGCKVETVEPILQMIRVSVKLF